MGGCARICSGFVPAPPSSVGEDRLTSSRPSSERANPSRPPMAIALVRYKTLIDIMFSIIYRDIYCRDINNRQRQLTCPVFSLS